MQSLLEQYECSICLQLIVEPVSLSCKHLFCKTCLEELEDFSNETFKCPLCRIVQNTNQNLVIDGALQKKIQGLNPEKFRTRMDQLQKEKYDKNRLVKIKILYGNWHENIQNDGKNTHRWTLFVRLQKGIIENQYIKKSSDLIHSVNFKLHETFRPPEITVFQEPFQVTRLGWGVFDIPITIHFKPSLKLQPLKLEHYLSFDGNGEEKAYLLKLSPEELDKLKIPEQQVQQQQQMIQQVIKK